VQQNLFQPYLRTKSIFKRNRDILRPSYVPSELPHRNKEVEHLASILAMALHGERPSNVLVFGKTGTGKTAVLRYLGKELDRVQKEGNVAVLAPHDVERGDDAPEQYFDVNYFYLNCEIVDTHYGVLQNVGNRFIEDFDDRIPFTGWPTETVYTKLKEKVDEKERVVILILDEIDKLVYKSGDDVLYYLLKLNDDLKNAKVCLIGISNDLKFTEFLDPRVRSRLGEEKMVFPPYNAEQLKDILDQRAGLAFETGVVTQSVTALCAALAAQEHGDARRALDLLRVSAELAERSHQTTVSETYVYRAKNKIELDCITEVVRTLPIHSKLVLMGITMNTENGQDKLTTGEVFEIYKRLCNQIGTTPLTQRRITDLISELDMLGLIHVRLISKGRYGRTREISISVPIEETMAIIEEDEMLREMKPLAPRMQTTLPMI